MAYSTTEFNDLLASAASGDTSSAEQLFPMVYGELHKLATALMRDERKDHSLQPTALIHAAYLSLAKQPDDGKELSKFENIGHFMATAAVVMRRILVNHAKSKNAQKRGGDMCRLVLDNAVLAFESSHIDLVELDDILEQLRILDPVQHKLVEMRFFSGMTMEQCAQILNISPRSAYLEWAHARAWLKQRLVGQDDGN